MPLVSVGVPVYNGERFLARAVDSILSQSVTDIEVIIVNNASTDATDDICQEAVARDSRIRYVRQPHNVGAAANFNRTLELAGAEYFCWLAHDDWVASDYLAKCLRRLAGQPDVVLCSSMMGVTDDTGGVFRERHERLSGADAASARSRYHSMIWTLRDPTAPVFGVMRTSAVVAAGGIPLVPEPDRQLLYDLALRGRLRSVPEVLFFHYGPRGHMTHYGSGSMRRRSWDWLQAPDVHRTMLASAGRILAHQLRVVANSNLSAADKAVCLLDVVASTALVRTRSKVRRMVRARRQLRARSLRERSHGEFVQPG